MNLKSLAKDTAIYGLSSIVGRFLNYLLVILYSYTIPAGSGGYGIVTNLYAYTALFLTILTFGMETTLFRFTNKEGEDGDKVYGTILRMVGTFACLFVGLVLAFLRPIAGAMGYAAHPEYVGCMALIVGFDAFQAILFSRLRQQRRAVKFMVLKFAFIIPNILLNLFVFLWMKDVAALQGVWTYFDNGIGLIFFSNLLCTTLVFFGFSRELKGLSYGFDKALARRLLRYSWPLLLLGLVGILNQVADKILFPYLMPGTEGKVQLGIYGACVKLAMVMAILTQAFRYAYEPIVFAESRGENSPETLADGMKYFIVFTLLAFLAVMFYMPVLRYFLQRDYWPGLQVVPVVMLAEIFMGVYFNLSFWYKLCDKTWWGAVMSAAGALVMVAINVFGVPRIGYWACAWGGFAGYGVAMLLSFFIGRHHYPVRYDGKTIGAYVLLAATLYALSRLPVAWGWEVPGQLVCNTLLLLLYAYPLWRMVRKNVHLKQ